MGTCFVVNKLRKIYTTNTIGNVFVFLRVIYVTVLVVVCSRNGAGVNSVYLAKIVIMTLQFMNVREFQVVKRDE